MWNLYRYRISKTECDVELSERGCCGVFIQDPAVAVAALMGAESAYFTSTHPVAEFAMAQSFHLTSQ